MTGPFHADTAADALVFIIAEKACCIGRQTNSKTTTLLSLLAIRATPQCSALAEPTDSAAEPPIAPGHGRPPGCAQARSGPARQREAHTRHRRAQARQSQRTKLQF